MTTRPVTIWPTQALADTEASRLGQAGVYRPAGHRSLYVVIPDEQDRDAWLKQLAAPAATARVTDIATARAAGERDRSTDRDLALAVHASRPDGLTDFELADLMHRVPTSAGKRRLELCRDGLVVQTDERRTTPSGSPATVWRITAAGREAAHLLHPSITSPEGGAA